MKRFDMSTILSALALIILIVVGCAKVQRPSLDTDSYLNRGVAYGKKGLYDQAIVDFNKAVELNPRDATAYYNRGISYGKKGQYDQAIVDFNKAIELDPRDAAAYYNRGISYEKRGQHDRAILDFTKAIEINPGMLRHTSIGGLPIFPKENTRRHGMMSLKYKI